MARIIQRERERERSFCLIIVPVVCKHTLTFGAKDGDKIIGLKWPRLLVLTDTSGDYEDDGGGGQFVNWTYRPANYPIVMTPILFQRKNLMTVK